MKKLIIVITFLLYVLTIVHAQSDNEGIIVPGETLAEKFTWLTRSADSHNTYILIVTANENIDPQTIEYKGAINITIILKGDNENRTIRLRSHGSMFTISSDIVFILENNITLQGHAGNDNAIIRVNGGSFIMRHGSTITGNSNTSSNSYIGSPDTGGVYLNSGTFEMTDGNITDNNGRGVYVANNTTFTMNSGNITGNGNIVANGGGVYVDGTFTMRDGVISGNVANTSGGGVAVQFYGTFNMRGGTITGNKAGSNGGGVVVGSHVKFIKTGGVITGYNTDQSNGNVVKDDDGVLARRGHAVFVNGNIRKEITADSEINMSYNASGSNWRKPIVGGWEN